MPFHLYSPGGPVRYLFVKHHAAEHGDDGIDSANRVFVASIPSGVTEQELVTFLVDVAGPVEQVCLLSLLSLLRMHREHFLPSEARGTLEPCPVTCF